MQIEKIFLSISVLLILGAGLFPFSTNASACVCYFGDDGSCAEVFTELNATASDCQKQCETLFSDNLHSAKFEGGDSFGEQVDLNLACTQARLNALKKQQDKGRAPLPVTDIVFAKPLLNVNIPTVSFSAPFQQHDLIKSNIYAEYVSGVYTYLIIVSVTFAIIMIMIGGLQYTFGGVSQNQISSAKNRIKNGITGLVLLLMTYMILYTVNPNLTLLQTPELGLIQEVPLNGSAMESANDGGDLDASAPTSSGFNNVPVFKQSGTPWGKQAFGNLPLCPNGKDPKKDPATCCSSYGHAGCGVTSLAMILKFHGENVDPKIVGDYAVNNKARVCNYGTNNIAFRDINKKWSNLKSKTLTRKQAKKILESDNPLPLATSTPTIKGCYERGGHWIVLTGIDDDDFVRVNDPASGNCFVNRNSSDGFYGSKGEGLTSMTMANFNTLSTFWLIAPAKVIDNLKL